MQPALKNNKGISIVEIMVAIFIISVSLGGVLTASSYSLKLSELTAQETQANFLAQEGIEAVRNFRDGTQWAVNGLGTMASGISYYPEKTGTTDLSWSLAMGEDTNGIFTRKIVFNRVFRDSNDDISESGSEDVGTKKVTVTVSWQGKQTELITYIANWQE